MSLKNFQDWKTKYVEWLAAETSGDTVSSFEETPDELFVASPEVLENETFMGESIYSPAATIAYKTAYSRVQAHRRDFPCLLQTRAAYHAEQSEDETVTGQLLTDLEAVLMRMTAFKET